jgi:hypothetical protein
MTEIFRYEVIRQHRSAHQKYAAQLMAEGVVTADEVRPSLVTPPRHDQRSSLMPDSVLWG